MTDVTRPTPLCKPDTIKGHALSTALRTRAVEWSSEVDVDAWIADIEAEARTATAEAAALAARLVERLRHHRIAQMYGNDTEVRFIQHCTFLPAHRPDESCPDCDAIAAALTATSDVG